MKLKKTNVQWIHWGQQHNHHDGQQWSWRNTSLHLLGQCIFMDSFKRTRNQMLHYTGKASTIFKNKDIPIILKHQVYDQCLLPTVTYGAESWNLSKQQYLNLRTVQRAYERIMKISYGKIAKQLNVFVKKQSEIF